jgi:hypothetical protein
MRMPGRQSQSAASVEGDLARLADGTLQGSRRERLERLVAGSPELQARLDEQRRAVAATRLLAHFERAPVTLRMQHQALTRRGRRRAPVFGLGLAGAAGVMVWTVVAVGGGQATLTVAQAATIAVRPATATVAEPPEDQVTLPHLRAAGLAFPYWEDRFGWRATGMRTDRVDGRSLTTVFYRRGSQQIAYTIVGGQALPPAANARTTVRGGTVLASSSTGGRLVVTWLRRGHTCVLSGGGGVSANAMLNLAGWRSHGRIPY